MVVINGGGVIHGGQIGGVDFACAGLTTTRCSALKGHRTSRRHVEPTTRTGDITLVDLRAFFCVNPNNECKQKPKWFPEYKVATQNFVGFAHLLQENCTGTVLQTTSVVLLAPDLRTLTVSLV